MVKKLIETLWLQDRRGALVTLSLIFVVAVGENLSLLVMLVMLSAFGMPSGVNILPVAWAARLDWRLLVALFVVTALIMSGLNWIAARQQAGLGIRFGQRLRERLLARFSALPYERMRGFEAARISKYLTQDCTQAQATANTILGMVVQIVVAIGYFGTSLWIAPLPTLGIALATAVVWWINRDRSDHGQLDRVSNAALRFHERVADFSLGFKTVRAHGLDQRYGDRMVAAAAGYGDALLQRQREGLKRRTRQQISAVTLLTLILCASRIPGVLPLQSFLALLLIYMRMAPRVQGLQQLLINLALTTDGFRAVQKLLDEPLPAGSVAVTDLPIPGDIVLSGIDYEYEAGSAALHPISARLVRGRWTALVGVSGSGKTTLLDLLVRLEEPRSDSIRLGNQRFAAIDPFAWRSQLAYVTQTPTFQHGTLRDNLLAHADASVNDIELQRAIELCGLAPIVARLADGLETKLDAAGTRFSGGQRQRIALARALLRKPEWLLLDEATNALDAEAEVGILRAIRDARPGLSVIMVTHRPAAAAIADDVIDLQAAQETVA